MDTKLVIQAKKHDKEAFVKLIEDNQASMYKAAIAILQNDEDAADAIQETILICWEKIGSLRHAGYFKTWLMRILIHQCYAIYNQKKRMITAEKFPDIEDQSEGYGEIEWQEMLRYLNEKQRIVVELYYGQQFKVREIAEALQIGQSAVKSRLQSARKALKKYYDIGKEKLAATAVVLVIIGGGVLAVNPSLAAKLPLIGSIFQQVEKEAVYSGEYKNSEQIKPEETSCLSAENQGIKLTASEVYCDGFSVYVTMQMQSEQIDFSKETKRICVKTRYGFQKQITQEDSDILIDGKCVDKHTFIGMMKFDKTDVIKEDEKLSIQILTIYFREESLSGRWDFEIPYTVYEEGSREIAVNKNLSSHLMIKNVFISPYQIVVFTKETEGVHSQIALFDQNGKKISFEEIGDKEGRWERKLYARNGRVITKLYGYVTTEDSIALYKAKTRKEAKRLSMYQFSVDVL